MNDYRTQSNYPMQPGFVFESATSAEAAGSIAPSAASMRARTLALLRERPDGLTSDELEELTGWRHQTASARLRELVLAEEVWDSPVRRKTRSGRKAVVRKVVL